MSEGVSGWVGGREEQQQQNKQTKRPLSDSLYCHTYNIIRLVSRSQTLYLIANAGKGSGPLT